MYACIFTFAFVYLSIYLSIHSYLRICFSIYSSISLYIPLFISISTSVQHLLPAIIHVATPIYPYMSIYPAKYPPACQLFYPLYIITFIATPPAMPIWWASASQVRGEGKRRGGCSSVVEHSTADREVPGSIPGAPSFYLQMLGSRIVIFNLALGNQSGALWLLLWYV